MRNIHDLMNNIILTAFENRCPLNSFNFLAFRIMKITIPKIERLNMHIVYRWILKVHSILCIIQTCSCLVTASTSLNYCKVRLVTKDVNLACLHIMYKTTDITTKNNSSNTQKNIYSIITKKGIILSEIYTIVMPFSHIKNSLFMLKLVHKVVKKFLVISVNQGQNQRIVKKWVSSVHV